LLAAWFLAELDDPSITKVEGGPPSIAGDPSIPIVKGGSYPRLCGDSRRVSHIDRALADQ